MRICRISSSCKPLWPHSSWCYCRWSSDSKGKKDESLQVASLMYVYRKNVMAGTQHEWFFLHHFFLFQTSRSYFRGSRLRVSLKGISWQNVGASLQGVAGQQVFGSALEILLGDLRWMFLKDAVPLVYVCGQKMCFNIQRYSMYVHYIYCLTDTWNFL